MFKARLVTFSSLGIALFLLFSTLILVFTMPESMAPDEEMRNDIPEWIALHKALPIGNEAELTYNVWGFSYGFLPYLPSLLALPLIFVLENFLPLHTSVLLASRLISVLSLLLSFIFSLKIANYLFHDKKVNYLFSVSIVLLPQVIFISSYHNNDSFGLM